MRRRPGFSLLEVTIATGILMTIMMVVVNSFVGTRKAQGAAVTASLLKSGGQRATSNLYRELLQSRKLIASLAGTTGKDLPSQYYSLMEIPQLPEPLADTERVFPQINTKGAFGVTGKGQGTLDPDTVGNALMFVEPADPMVLADDDVYVREGNSGASHEMAKIPYKLPTYRFVLYHMVKVELPASAPNLDSDRHYTLQLMRWESKPFLEKNDLNLLINRYTFPTLASLSSTTAQWNDLANRPPKIAGIWDSSATTGATAIVLYPQVTVSLGPPIAIGLGAWAVDPSPAIAMSRQSWAITTNLAGYAQAMLSFNTRGNPNFQVNGLDVPAYASAPTVVPYGFETAIAGPIGARSVLVRLALAARLNAGNTLFGMEHQEVVKVFDM
jgi:hypothetical protein